MSSKSEQFAKTVLAAFEIAGLVTDVEVGAAGGPSTTYMTNLRKAALGNEDLTEPRSDTYRRIETAAGWPPGAARALYREGTPPVEPGTAKRPWTLADTKVYGGGELAERVRQAVTMAGSGTLTLGGRPAGQRPVPVTFANLDQIIFDLQERVTELEEIVEIIAGLSPREPRLSEVSYRPEGAVAADEQEQSIAGEQEQRQEP